MCIYIHIYWYITCITCIKYTIICMQDKFTGKFCFTCEKKNKNCSALPVNKCIYFYLWKSVQIFVHSERRKWKPSLVGSRNFGKTLIGWEPQCGGFCGGRSSHCQFFFCWGKKISVLFLLMERHLSIIFFYWFKKIHVLFLMEKKYFLWIMEMRLKIYP